MPRLFLAAPLAATGVLLACATGAAQTAAPTATTSGVAAVATPAAMQSLPATAGALDARDVLALMERVADWQLAHPSAHVSTDWTQGVGDAGMAALANLSGQPRFRDALLRKGERDGWQLGPAPYHADDQVVAQTYLDLYALQRDPRMITPTRSGFDFILAHPSKRSLEFIRGDRGQIDRWSWCDALFMGPPAWVRLSALTGDPRYLEFAVAEWWRTSDYLYDKDAHLYSRDSTYFSKREANGQKVFWGRGNGWVMGGLVRVLQYLPMNHPLRPRFEQQFREMSAALLAAQQPDGLWRASLLDPASYPLKEGSGSSLITYGLAWGINTALLDKARYEPAVRKAWAALRQTVHADGKATHIQPIGASPAAFDQDATEVYGVGALLLAGSEMYRMALLAQAPGQLLTVSNPLAIARQEEMVELPWTGSEVPAVFDERAWRLLPAQRIDGKLIFQVDLGPSERRGYRLLPAAALPALPRFASKTYARFVPERLDDFAWENDRIAHRMYGPALMTDPKEKLTSSGVDVWVKSLPYPVVDKWYKAGDYHVDHGEGLDDYSVGTSRGCGGLGFFDGKAMLSAANFKRWRILANGPLRSQFELEFDPIQDRHRTLTQTLRIAIDAGSQFSRVESLVASNLPDVVDAGIGIARRQGGQFTSNSAGKWISYWQPEHAPNGSIGCAVIVPDSKSGDFTISDGNFMALAPIKPGEPWVYYLGAAWSKRAGFETAALWEHYVEAYAQRRRSPVQLELVPVR
jgi:rhamnogalacturonyl hydrolase YesR